MSRRWPDGGDEEYSELQAEGGPRSGHAEGRGFVARAAGICAAPFLFFCGDRSSLISAVANLSIQYNFQSLVVALVLMQDPNNKSDAAFPHNTEEESLLKSLVFAGAITGQLTMGYAGDAMGRRKAMLLTNLLTFLGALGSAVFPWGAASTMYTIMMVCRFVLGVGVGGKYPLAATMSAEKDKSSKSHSSTEVAKGFFWQTPGTILPYMVGLAVLYGFGTDKVGKEHSDTVNMQFRIILGIGAVPAFVVMWLTYLQPESTEYTQAARVAPNPFVVARRHPEYWGGLIGTGVCWALYDFVYYGSASYQPTIIGEIFGKNETLAALYGQNIAVSAMGLPGVIAAVLMLKWMGTKRLQSWGFLLVVVFALPFAVVLWNKTDKDQAPTGSMLGVEFSLLCALIFVLNWGVNVSTYVLPTEVFPVEVRSSFFGISAAMAKVGALIGSSTFEAIGVYGYGRFGMTYAVCALFALLAVVLTHFFVEPRRQSDEGSVGESEIDPKRAPLVDWDPSREGLVGS